MILKELDMVSLYATVYMFDCLLQNVFACKQGVHFIVIVAIWSG